MSGFKNPASKLTFQIISLNLVVAIFGGVYLYLRYSFINTAIPLWYSKPWGTMQLSPKENIILIPITMFLIITIGSLLSFKVQQIRLRYGIEVILGVITMCTTLLTISLFRIIYISSSPFEPLIDPKYFDLIVPFIVGFALAYLITPHFIKFTKKRNIVTDPTIHKHPGMLLKKPSSRGGGIVFMLAFVITAFLFTQITKFLVGIAVAVFFTAIIGLLDDISNTNPSKLLEKLCKPLTRLLILQPISVIFLLLAGIKTNFIGNPFDGVIYLDQIKMSFGSTEIAPIALLFTMLWVIWVINMLSWSNGVDGQYSGIIGIAGIVIAILSLRLIEIEPSQTEVAKLAVIAAGASIGLIPFTWHPSKIMWGFGATAAGVVLATLSILTRAKIATSIIVLLIPFMDALITIARRVIQKKSPLKGDSAHLHHLLVKKGWSIQKIAIFYWVSTAVLGIIALASSDKTTPLVILTLTGVIAFGIISLNLKLAKEKQEQQQLE